MDILSGLMRLLGPHNQTKAAPIAKIVPNPQDVAPVAPMAPIPVNGQVNPQTNALYQKALASYQNALPLRVQPNRGMQVQGSADGVFPQAQGSQPNLTMSMNPQIAQGGFGLQGQFGGPDTSSTGGADAQARFTAQSPLFRLLNNKR